MAVSDRPEVTYVFEARVADLGRISKINGFFTDVRVARSPNWTEEQHELMIAEARPSLWAWDYTIDAMPDGDNTSQRLRTLAMMVQGYVEASSPDSLYAIRLALADDVDHAFMSNPQSRYPGSSAGPNTWGINTRLVRQIRFDNLRGAGMENIGFFNGIWALDYMTPR
jgi:hypothetical protein